MADEQTEVELTDEQIEQQLEDFALGKEPTEPIVEEVGEAEPEPEEVLEETTEEVATEEPVEPAEPEGEAEPEPEVDLDSEIMESRFKSLEAEKQKWESVAGRHAGKMDFLERQLRSLNQPMPPQSEPQVSEYDEAPAERQQAPQQSEKVTSWAVSQAMQTAGAQFAAQHPEVSEMGKEFGDYLSSVNFNTESMLLSDDPAYVQNEVTSVLKEAYHHVTAQREEARLTGLKERRADQTTKLEKAKEKAGVSAASNTPPPKPKEITDPGDMSDEQLEAKMEEATRGRW